MLATESVKLLSNSGTEAVMSVHVEVVDKEEAEKNKNKNKNKSSANIIN